MRNISKFSFIAIWLFAGLGIQSCDEKNIEFEKQLVQFTLSPASSSSVRVSDIDLPDNAIVKMSVVSKNGSVSSDFEVPVVKSGDLYMTEPIRLMTGAYMITDFMIVKDTIGLYVTPKKGAEITISNALPYEFAISGTTIKQVRMQVMDVRNQDLKRFGYSSSKAKQNPLSIAVYERVGEDLSLTAAAAEIYQNKKFIKRLTLSAAVNTIDLGGDQKTPYTLTVYTTNSAKTQTFSLKAIKHQIGKNPLEIILEPALVLGVTSYVEPGNEYEDYFEYRMAGNGSVNINWGDGDIISTTLPFEISHEYFSGDYALIVTGDLYQVTDFTGFSYSTIISTITGLTNLPSLKVYDPSWGAVPIKVDLSNCTQLEKISIAKYGAPYEPIDLRTDFKLPSEHFINTFIFDAPSFDSNREFISAEELEVMFNNIYGNAIARQIYNGQFLVNPVVTPLPSTQQKIDILQNDYGWNVAFNDDIWSIYNLEIAKGAVSATDLNALREQWLRERFSNSEHIIQRAEIAGAFK